MFIVEVWFIVEVCIFLFWFPSFLGLNDTIVLTQLQNDCDVTDVDKRIVDSFSSIHDSLVNLLRLVLLDA